MINFINALPKVELHLHLEGAIPIPALWQLLVKYDGTKEIKNLKELEQKFIYKDFPSFIRTWVWKNNFLREYEDFTYIAEEVALDLAAQNIVYVEAFFSPGDFARHGLKAGKLAEAIRKGLDKHTSKIKINLVMDLIRDFGPEKGMNWLHEIVEFRHLGVLGVGIGGSEKEFPPEAYKNVYEEARKLGFKTSAHAGEAAGTESIWGAIKELKVDRIGHGTMAIHDLDLVKYLHEKKIPIEMCPISNFRTGIWHSEKNHPIGEFYRNGLMVTVNTDDPKMFQTSLKEEYLYLVENFRFTKQDLINLNLNAVNSAWCDDSLKHEIINKINKQFSNRNAQD